MNNRHLYPQTWDRLSRECKERAGYKCEHCHVKQGKLRQSRITGNIYVVYLQAAHVNHDRHNETPVLKCVCPACHWRYYRQRRNKKNEQWLRGYWQSQSLLEPELEQFTH